MLLFAALTAGWQDSRQAVSQSPMDYWSGGHPQLIIALALVESQSSF